MVTLLAASDLLSHALAPAVLATGLNISVILIYTTIYYGEFIPGQNKQISAALGLSAMKLSRTELTSQATLIKLWIDSNRKNEKQKINT